MKMPTDTVKNKIKKISTVLFAVLSAFFILYTAWMSGRAFVTVKSETTGTSTAAVREIVRIVGSEMLAVQNRDNAYYYAFVDSGGRGEDYRSVKGEVNFDILCITENTVSFAVDTVLPDSSPYGRTGYYNVEQSSGNHLTPSDVMGDGWRQTVLDALLPQIKADGDVYDGIDVSPMINENRMFYLADGGDTVVIVFDTGEIAPDSAGVKKYRVQLK